MFKQYWRYYILVFAVWLAYVVLSIQAPQVNYAERLNIPLATIYFLRMTVAIPYLVTWLLALSGCLYFASYARAKLQGSVAAGYELIAQGLLILLVSLVFSAMGQSLRGWLELNQAVMLVTWARTLLNALLLVAGFTRIYQGARQLATRASFQVEVLPALLPVVVFAAFYLGLVFTNPIRQFSSDPNLAATYYMSDFWILLLVIVPNVAAWGLGMLSVLHFDSYMHLFNVPAERKAWDKFYVGFLAIIAGFILFQAVTSLGTSRLLNLGLGTLLTVVYGALALNGFGFFLIARTARRLAGGHKEPKQ